MHTIESSDKSRIDSPINVKLDCTENSRKDCGVNRIDSRVNRIDGGANRIDSGVNRIDNEVSRIDSGINSIDNMCVY